MDSWRFSCQCGPRDYSGRRSGTTWDCQKVSGRSQVDEGGASTNFQHNTYCDYHRLSTRRLQGLQRCVRLSIISYVANPTLDVKKLVIVVLEIRVNSCMTVEHVCTSTDTTLDTLLTVLRRSRRLAAGQAGRKRKKPSWSWQCLRWFWWRRHTLCLSHMSQALHRPGCHSLWTLFLFYLCHQKIR